MWKLAFITAALAISVSPADAAQESKGSELRRDVERIAKEIYPSPPPARAEPAPRPSFAAGRALKKR